MAKDFKRMKLEAHTIEPRAAIPQVDPAVVKPPEPVVQPALVEEPQQATTAAIPKPTVSTERPLYLTPVHSNEKGTSQAFQMLPSRHMQLKDLAYREGRNPWQIIEDALEEYVVKHYGKEHRRR